VDIFITCCGEPWQVAVDTVKAACSLDYPSERYRVFFLDDGDSDILWWKVNDLRKRYHNLHYATRHASIKTHSKAGNLNFGLEKSANVNSAEYVAVLDVDMIPSPHWLRALLPHILLNPDVVLANPPQHFYNVPRDDRLGVNLEWRWVADIVMPLQEAVGAAWCTGSGFVAKRSAIEEIGGYPEESLQEDNLTSTLLAAKGWKVAYVNEHVQWGLAADSLRAMVKQRCRLAAGNISMILFHLDQKIDGLSTLQRGHGIVSSLIYCYSTFSNTISMCILFGLLLTGKQLALLNAAIIKIAALDFAAQVLYGFFETRMTAHRTHILNHWALLWMDPYRFITILKIFINRMPSFSPTGAATTNNPRSPPTTYFGYGLIHWLHLATFLLTATAALHSTLYAITTCRTDSRDELAANLITRIGFPPLFVLWTAIIANAWVPVSYIFFGPAELDREDLLAENADGVRYPTMAAKANDWTRVGETHLVVSVAWFGVVLVGLWVGW